MSAERSDWLGTDIDIRVPGTSLAGDARNVERLTSFQVIFAFFIEVE
mgnify:CR=1 FL=1